jgi:flagellar biosynthetic protein FliQ
MTDTVILELLRQTFWVSLRIGGPVLGVALVVGVGIGLFQAVTQIQEMTLTFVPKAVAIAVILLFFGTWMMETLIIFTTDLFHRIPDLVR